MKTSNSPRKGIAKTLRILSTAIFLAGLLSSCSGPAERTTTPETATTKPADTATPTPESAQTSETKRRRDWGDQMLRKPAPRAGCFDAAYPSTDWTEVTCVKAPNIPALPRHGPRPAVVGNNNDISAQAPSGHITQAIGHFENVTNVTSIQGPIANAGPSIADTYTLQINSDFFSGSTACAASPNPNCLGWEQWIHWNTPGGGTAPGFAAMQYWLINFNATCPAGQGWNQIPLFGGTSCWKNSANSVSVPFQPITNMANWRLSGTATATGDSISLFDGTLAHTTNGDNAVAASTAWTIAEFNIFGYGGNTSGGGMASFNAGASADTRTQIFYGGTMAPNCVAQGFTAETNNLSFGPTAPAASAPGPAVIFQESIAGGAPSNCAAAVTVGDTHLKTFNGLFYDFQASGDFILAQTEPSFVVQTRQVSGAPTWPDATVNKAVATQMGKSQVAICLPARVIVDGKDTDVADGKSFSTAEGVDIRRAGNTYVITDQTGNSVRAVLHPSWIDVFVGLGRWPTTVTGLLANVENNVNKIATRDGTVLTNPFSFDELYQRYGESWRVSPNESLLSACGDRSVERGNPSRPFFARDLDRSTYDRTRAVCIAAGVKGEAFLDACTLDVAVIGDDAAAQVFVTLPQPIAVGNVTGGGKGSRYLLWLLLLILLIILLIWWLLRRRRRTTP
jgi:hypothetical protein